MILFVIKLRLLIKQQIEKTKKKVLTVFDLCAFLYLAVHCQGGVKHIVPFMLVERKP